MPITLVLANHQPIVLDGLTQLFAREQDFFVLASHTNSAETLESVRRHRPAVLVLGVSPPATDGLTVLREMQEENLPTRAVVFTGGIDEQEIVEAIRLGARGVVLKEMAPRLLLQCIRKVHAGGEWFETRSIGHLVGRIRQGDATAQQSRGADAARDRGRAARGAGPEQPGHRPEPVDRQRDGQGASPPYLRKAQGEEPRRAIAACPGEGLGVTSTTRSC